MLAPWQRFLLSGGHAKPCGVVHGAPLRPGSKDREVIRPPPISSAIMPDSSPWRSWPPAHCCSVPTPFRSRPFSGWMHAQSTAIPCDSRDSGYASMALTLPSCIRTALRTVARGIAAARPKHNLRTSSPAAQSRAPRTARTAMVARLLPARPTRTEILARRWCARVTQSHTRQTHTRSPSRLRGTRGVESGADTSSRRTSGGGLIRARKEILDPRGYGPLNAARSA